MSTFNYRLKQNGKLLHGAFYTLQGALDIAASITLQPGEVLQVIDDGVDKEVVKAEYKGSAHNENE